MFYREGPDKHLCRTGFIISKTQTEFVTKVGQKCEESMYQGMTAEAQVIPVLCKEFLFRGVL